jgi:hypothetical protein
MTTDRLKASSSPVCIGWQSVIAGALAGAALSSVLLAFGAAIGLSVYSTSPTWRDASAALALLSGFFLLLQSVLAFGLGGYIAGRAKNTTAAPVAEVERNDGFHGLLTWALAVILGAVLVTFVAGVNPSGKTSTSNGARSNVAEPLLSYELDRLFRAPRRAANLDLTSARDEAGRILLTSASHSGMTQDDRAYLVQLVSNFTGLAAADSERRADDVTVRAQTAIHNSRRTAVILAFSFAAALLVGSVVAWSAAVAGGRHRDGEPLPRWMSHGDYLARRRPAVSRVEPAPAPLPE